MRLVVQVSIVVGLICVGVFVRAAERPTETYRLPGLEQPAQILVDEWGVPHIYAKTHYDAFFVQGFNAARDRLWQIDSWRRRGLGQLSEVLGSKYVAQDRATRLFLYRGDMYREWLAYGSDSKRIAEEFPMRHMISFFLLIASLCYFATAQTPAAKPPVRTPAAGTAASGPTAIIHTSSLALAEQFTPISQLIGQDAVVAADPAAKKK